MTHRVAPGTNLDRARNVIRSQRPASRVVQQALDLKDKPIGELSSAADGQPPHVILKRADGERQRDGVRHGRNVAQTSRGISVRSGQCATKDSDAFTRQRPRISKSRSYS